MIESLALILAASQSCNNMDSCYAEAKAAISDAVTVQYNDLEIVTEAKVVRCSGGFVSCSEIGDARYVYPSVAWTALPNVDGQGLRASPGNWTGYAGLNDGANVTIGRTDPGAGYTVQATFLYDWNGAGFMISIRDAGTNMVYSAGFPRLPGKFADFALITKRWATTERGKVVEMADRPWDFTQNLLRLGPTEFRNAPEPGRLYEMYLTFRGDGKVEIDVFSVADTTRDFLVSHIQDTGAAIEAYPKQAASGPWQAPVYRRAQTATVHGSSVLQLVSFNRALTRAERIAFHGKNLFYRMNGKIGTASLAHDQVPCNSGEFLNLLQKDKSRTVCGDRPGVLTSKPASSSAHEE